MTSRPVQVFVVVLITGAFLYGVALPFLRIPPLLFWATVLVAGLLAGVSAARKTASGGRFPGSPGGFLCDSCRYDDARYCGRPERPNATRCPDYRPR